MIIRIHGENTIEVIRVLKILEIIIHLNTF